MVTASAPPFHSALTTAWMSCWCTTSRFLSPLGGVDDLLGRVGEGDLDARARALDQARRVAELLDLRLEPLDRVVVDLGAELGHLVGQLADLVGQALVALRLGVTRPARSS